MDSSDVGIPRPGEAGRIWLSEDGETLVRFKSSPLYREFRDSDGVDEEHPFTACEAEIRVMPLHNYRPEISWPEHSFDLGGSESGGYPKVADCARSMHLALVHAGHIPTVLVRTWKSNGQGSDRAAWQIEYRGQHDLADDSHVEAMRRWMDAGAPLAFIAKLTANEYDRVKELFRPILQLEAVDKPKIVPRIGGAKW